MDSALYEKELRLPQWGAFRKSVFEKRGEKCELCGSAGKLEVHHKRYYKAHHPWEYEIEDVMVLCPRCHEEQHRKLGVIFLNGGGREISELGYCARCAGDGYFHEFVHVFGGKCLRCLGSGREDFVHLSMDSVWELSLDIWNDIQDNECRETFPGVENVFDWVAGIHGYSKKERNGYLEYRTE